MSQYTQAHSLTLTHTHTPIKQSAHSLHPIPHATTHTHSAFWRRSKRVLSLCWSRSLAAGGGKSATFILNTIQIQLSSRIEQTFSAWNERFPLRYQKKKINNKIKEETKSRVELHMKCIFESRVKERKSKR